MSMLPRSLSSTAVLVVPLLIVSLAGQAAPARAELTFTAVLDGQHAVPPTDSSATGTATLVLNDARTEVRYSIQFTGLVGQETAAHFHRGKAGTIGPILYTLPLGSSKAGVWPVSEEEVADLLAGRVYILVHSDPYWTGEIRGDLELVSLATDRATWGRLKSIFSQP
jgi:hypothetical protein